MVSFCVIPFIWGLSEAVFFFIVPDVWLTWLAFTKEEQKLKSSILWALAGALLGGVFMYAAGRQLSYEQITGYLVHIPGISHPLINTVSQQLQHDGAWSVFEGVLKAIPYKIYAVLWGAKGGSFWVWVFVSIIARGSRFFFSVVLARLIDVFCQKSIKSWSVIKKGIFFAFWFSFYILYFIIRS